MTLRSSKKFIQKHAKDSLNSIGNEAENRYDGVIKARNFVND